MVNIEKDLERFNEEWSGLTARSIEEADVVIKAIPFDSATSVGKGAAEGPDKIRQITKTLPAYDERGFSLEGFKVRDEGNFAMDLDWARFFGTVEVGAKKLMETGKFCFFLGGDHSVTIPLMKAFGQVHQEKEKIGYIHFDSHSDICDTFEGHPWSHGCPARRALDNCTNLHDTGVTFVGIRAYEEDEVDYFSKHPNIKVIQAWEVAEKGTSYAVETLKERYKDFDAIYLTVDIDVLDPAFAPGTGTPEAGGLATRELQSILRAIIRELPIVSMDMVEVSPPLDSSNITSWAAAKLMYSIFGQRYQKTREQK